MAPRRKTTIFRRASRALQQQIGSSNITKAIQVGNVKLCYASYTSAGSDGNGDKENQDCLAIEVLRHERDRDAEPVMFFGVFDGHGEHGGTVAALAAEQLPQFVGELHPQAGDPEAALLAGFASTQQFLLQQSGLDCGMSGCTAVAALLVNDSLLVANAGDSRCLAGRFEGNHELVAYELSNDHTPALLHEANRILASGGRIAPLEYAGRNVGPPRVWERNADQPGLCITRSLGDTQAKRLGVTHVPELATFKLTSGDRYLALVSDGITEFMGSQEIIEKVHKWATAGTMPHEVARRLVREARTRWKELGGEGIVDDCTAVVAYLVFDEEGEGEDDEQVGSKKKKKKKKKSHRAKGGSSAAHGNVASGGGDDGDVQQKQQKQGGRRWALQQQASALWTTVREALAVLKRENASKQKQVDV
ncbi:hypothetical protein Vretimale_4528 [Volvox reticuliferus]|uniref:protein-serine/threonine phosphatase n=2 Tax=Volvox reticuliferus TaxID=1737510 RepID=A0A8J4G2J4_9CHLO|nr:hypothetical protein Vretimale_4528 [Volvox reticuliferus]